MTLPARILLLAFWTVGGCAVTSEGQSSTTQIVPVDEGAKDPSFRDFRAGLLQAARNGQVGVVIDSLAEDVKRHEHQAEGGRAEFVRYWRLNREPQRFLSLLIGVLEFGGRFNESGEFVAPYTYTEFPGPEHDIHKYVILTESDVPVYSAASRTAKVRQRLSYALLRAGTGPPGWVMVELPTGIGYVREEVARRPSNPYAHFRQVGGKWKLALFVEIAD